MQDSLEKYGRSNCVIIYGSHYSKPEKQQVSSHHDDDSCGVYVLQTLNNNLNLPIKVTNNDIDICHPLPSSKKKNSIIVKFVWRTVRNMIFNHKKDLMAYSDSTGNKLSITESLTKRRLQLLDVARSTFQFTNVRTTNGNVVCKFKGTKHYINDCLDVEKIRYRK